LLEGGPTLAESFLRADLVDKVMVFTAPRVAGKGQSFVLPHDELHRLTFETGR